MRGLRWYTRPAQDHSKRVLRPSQSWSGKRSGIKSHSEVNAAVVKMPPVRDPVSEGITRIENQDRDKAKAKMEFGSFVKECREEREKTKWIQSVQRAEFPPVLHPKTVMDYTQLINFYRLKKNFDMVKTIWEVMLARNIIPSQHTYSSLIAACLIPIHDRTWNNQEDSRYNEFKVLEAIKLAESAFDHAVAGPERPNLYVINAMLSVYARRGMFVEAVWLFNRLRADFYHVQPDVITYTCVLDACFRGGEFEHGWRLFDDYEVMNPIMDPKCYIVAMRACIFARDPHRAISLFNDMVRVGYIPTTYHFNILLNACILDKEHYPLAFDFLKRMISSHDYLPDRVSFHTLLQGCRLHRDLPRALAVMKLAESLADGSTFVCMNQVISATMQEEFVSPGEDKKPLSKDDRVQLLLYYFQQMLQLQIRPTTRLMNSFFLTIAEAGSLERGFQFLRLYKALNVDVDSHTISILCNFPLEKAKLEDFSDCPRMQYGFNQMLRRRDFSPSFKENIERLKILTKFRNQIDPNAAVDGLRTVQKLNSVWRALQATDPRPRTFEDTFIKSLVSGLHNLKGSTIGSGKWLQEPKSPSERHLLQISSSESDSDSVIESSRRRNSESISKSEKKESVSKHQSSASQPHL